MEMLNSTSVKILFAFMVVLQCWIPASMILNNEAVIKNGFSYKFKTAPIDPSDPFRGKYVDLAFEENSLSVTDPENWINGESVYLRLTQDEEGYAKLLSVSRVRPDHDIYFTAKINRIKTKDDPELVFNYPFERFYMEESKAYEAEQLHRSSRIDSTKSTYAVVKILGGESALIDVQINGESLKELVKERQE
ncbi:GDYXXLXY domain-containing protein [Chitinophagales bacterium]|nr:GDYXXLXY domain-containing protein [Chitinophagales bacterium]